MTAAAVALALAACSTTTDVRIELFDEDGDCRDVFARVTTLSIEAIASAGRCRLDHKCALPIRDRSLAGFEAALRDSNAGALLELPADDAQVLVLNGRPGPHCFPILDGDGNPVEDNKPVLCAYANFAQARGGVIELELEADSADTDCPESPAHCP
jgi:hypothetical protein